LIYHNKNSKKLVGCSWTNYWLEYPHCLVVERSYLLVILFGKLHCKLSYFKSDRY